MQAWLFLEPFWTPPRVQSYLSKIPPVRIFDGRNDFYKCFPTQGGMILLDLYSEARPQYANFESYYGHHYIWNMLHDFGGINGLFGSLVNVTAVGESLQF